jgi:hypothetical protein
MCDSSRMLGSVLTAVFEGGDAPASVCKYITSVVL